MTQVTVNRRAQAHDSYNVHNAQGEVVLVDFYPSTGRAYLHLKTLRRYHVTTPSELSNVRVMGPQGQRGYNLSAIQDWSVIRRILNQL